MSLDKLGKFTYAETGYQGSNLGCIVSEKGLVLIDTPLLPADAISWGKAIRKLGKPIYQINTHHHYDHMIGNGAFGARTIAHENEAVELAKPDGSMLHYFIERRQDFEPDVKEQILNTPLLPPEITFKDRLSLHLGDVNIEMWYTGGHCSSCIFVHVVEDNILFTGDVLHKDITPFLGQGSFKEWIDVLAATSRQEYKAIVPGHGGLSGNKEVKLMLRFLRVLWNGVSKGYKAGKSSAAIIKEMRPHINYYQLVPGEEPVQKVEYDKAIGRLYDEIVARSKI
jgi:cyclase